MSTCGLHEQSASLYLVPDSGNPIINVKEIVFQGQIVVTSSRRASRHLRSLFKPRTVLVMFEYLWKSNPQELQV